MKLKKKRASRIIEDKRKEGRQGFSMGKFRIFKLWFWFSAWVVELKPLRENENHSSKKGVMT